MDYHKKMWEKTKIYPSSIVNIKKRGTFAAKIKRNIMAYYIKPIPTLTGDVAQRFNERAAEAEANRGSVDFSEQVETMRKILAEAKLGY